MSGIKLLVDSRNGIYVPQTFISRLGENIHVWGIEPADAQIIMQGPEHDEYWDAWEGVLDGASFTDGDGNSWMLYQEGDLFAYCEHLMTFDEHEQFFPDEHKSPPAGFYEAEVCLDCVLYIANDELPADTEQDGEEDRAIINGAAALGEVHLTPYWDEFSTSQCDCCGTTMAGTRHIVWVKEKVSEGLTDEVG